MLIPIALSSSRNAVSFSSARTTKRFLSPRCASVIQIVRPLESIAETRPKLHPALRSAADYLRRGFARFKLSARFLQTCSKRCNLFLELFNRSLLLQKGFVLFEKFVEQHRVHSFIADCVRLALLVASHQIRVDLLHVLSHEAELRDASRVKVLLVAKRHRF